MHPFPSGYGLIPSFNI